MMFGNKLTPAAKAGFFNQHPDYSIDEIGALNPGGFVPSAMGALPMQFGAMGDQVEYRQGQPMTLTPGQAIPQDQYRADQPGMMPFATPDAQKQAANGMMGRVSEAMKGFALPDVSKYGYSPESQGRVEGAGYLRETPIGTFRQPVAPQMAGSTILDTLQGPALPQAPDRQQVPDSPRWSVDGFDAMREQSQPQGLLPASMGVGRPSGLFGKRKAYDYDYDAATRSILPEEKKPSTFQKVMRVLGPALMAAGGNQEGANALLANFARERAERDRQRFETTRTIAGWQHDDFGKRTEAALKASLPVTIGRDRVVYDPDTGEASSVWHGDADWESYAQSQNLKPGTPAYFQAVEDYVLRGAGPSAMENYSGLDDHRTANDLRLEGARAGYRTSLEGLRQRGQLSLEGARAGNRTSLEDKRQTGRVSLRGVPSYRDTHGAPGRSTARPTATGPDGKSKVEWDGKAWVPVK